MIDRNRLTETFLTLARFDSESFGERQICDELTARLRALGLAVEEDEADALCGMRSASSCGNLYGFLAGSRPGEPILLSSHMDTVKPGRAKHPILHEDGRITSDGTTVLGADDAAGLAAILEALTAVVEDGLPHAGVEILFPAAEEIYGRGSAVFDYARLKSRLAYCFDLTGPIGGAVTEAPSVLTLRVTVNGVGAHAGFNPEDGVNALTAAARALARIPVGRVAEDTTVNFGTIRGGSVTNAVPATVELGGEIRSLRHEEAERRGREITEIFEEEARAVGASAEAEIREMVHAYRIGHDEEVVSRFVRAARAASLTPRLGVTFGAADNNHFVRHGLSGIVVASAMQNVHTVNEYTTVDDMEACARLILALIEEGVK